MTEEQEAELRYEAGMYQSLYENAKARIEQLEAALREISIYDANITKTIREALAPEQDK